VTAIDPNTSQWVTDKIAVHLGGMLGPGVRVVPVTASFGDPYSALLSLRDGGRRAPG
jgi:hypothetical protein